MGDGAQAPPAGPARVLRYALRRPLRWLGIGLAGGLAVAAAWIIVTGLLARGRLEAAKADLSRLQHAVSRGDLAAADRIARTVAADASRAHALTSGPAWWAAAQVPILGSPARTIRVLATEIDRLGRQTLPDAVTLADDLLRSARQRAGGVDLVRLQAAVPGLHSATEHLERAAAGIRAAGGSWLPSVADARTTVLRQLTGLTGELAGAERAVRIALPMLGRDRPQRIFLGFLNDAEARALGGIPGEFAVAVADHGRVRFERFGSDDDLRGVRAGVQLAADYTAAFGAADPAGVLQNSTIGPDFRDAARIWAGLWERRTGEHVDAAIAVDPTALGYLLDAVGPAQLPGGGRVGGHDVVALTEQRVYAEYPDKTARKRYLSAVARAVADRLLDGGGSTGLVRAAARAAGERRLMMWSADAAVEAQLVRAGYGAVLPTVHAPATGFVVTNTTGGKLDYYLDRTMTYERHGCGAGRAVATFTVTNAAPSGLPAYVTTRADDHAGRARPGDSRLLITYYGSAGARLETATVDGQPVQPAVSTLGGLTTVSIDLELPRGTTRTLTLRLAEPVAQGRTQVLRQPLVRPLRLQVRAPSC